MSAPFVEPTEAEAAVTHFRASLLRGLKAHTLQAGGPEAWRDLVDSLPPTARETFQQELSVFHWVPTEEVNALMSAHLARYGEDAASDRLRHTVQDQLTVVHAWLLKLLSPETLVHQAGTLFRFNYRGGLAQVEEVRAGHGTLRIWAKGPIPHWATHSVPLWVEHGMTLAGGRNLRVVHDPAPDGYRHRYEITWDP